MSHTVIVLAGNRDEGFSYAISGDCDSACHAYRECLNDKHPHPSEEYGWREGEWATKRVPEVHTFIEGLWMLPAGCGLDEAKDHLEDSLEKVGIGTWPIDVDWNGDYWYAEAYAPVEERTGSETNA